MQAEVLFQAQFELSTQLVADVNVEHEAGVPVQVAFELHAQFALAAHVLFVVNELHEVGVPVQVAPEDQAQLAETEHVALSAKDAQGVGVPVQVAEPASHTQPGKTAQVLSPEEASEQM